MKKIILGIKIDDVNIPEAVDVVKKWLSKGGKYYIVTPNPEIVVMAQKDLQLKNIINNADLAIPDGVGLKLTTGIENTSPGIDVMELLVKMAADLGFTTGFLGGRGDVADRCAERLKRKYPKLKVSFAESGGEVDENGNVIARSETTRQSKERKLTSSAYLRLPQPLRGFAMTEGVDLLFVAFGPPKQEKWIANNLAKLDVKVAMGVGGAFDYISGKVPRAPKWIRNLGFEWLFRLIVQPWRIKRQLTLIKYLLLLTMQ